ncbi:MAG TPA: TonB family protein [Terracidiphilus sp.]
MFEDAVFESTGRIHTRSRRWMLATFAFNSAVVLALALFPLLNPEALPGIKNILLMVAPPPQAAPPQPPPQQRTAQLPHGSEMMGPHIMAPRIIPPTPYVPPVPENPVIASAEPWGNDSTGKDLSVFRETHAGPAVRLQKPATARISQGVMEGLLIRKVVPSYPPLAHTMGIEGTVVLQASISKAGRIENLRVVSGPQLLQKAAIDAVSQWLYRPYLLNGAPVDVETTVNVTFTMH